MQKDKQMNSHKLVNEVSPRLTYLPYAILICYKSVAIIITYETETECES